MPGFSLRDPFNRRCQSSLSGLLTLGFGDPFQVFVFMAVTEILERRHGLFVSFQGGHQISRNDQFFPFFGLGSGRQPGPSLIESNRFFDIANQHLVLWQIGNVPDSAELSHPIGLLVPGGPALAED